MGNHSDTTELCFSLQIPFWEAHSFSEILSRLDTTFSAVSIYLSHLFSLPLLWRKGVSISGPGCFFSKLDLYCLCSTWQRVISAHTQDSAITALLKESHCSGNITGEWRWGRLLAPCLSGFQSALVKWSWFTVVVHCRRGEGDAKRGELLSVRTGRSGSGL